MLSFNHQDLSTWTGGQWTQSPVECATGFAIDSRKIQPGDLFIALRAQRNGHEFLNQAVQRGAFGSLVDHVVEGVNCPQLVVKNTLTAFQQIAKFYRNQFDGTVVGVTGSCGKTSTKEILKLLLNQVHATKGNLNNHLGVPLTLCEMNPDIHACAVIEAGINKTGEMKDLAELIQPNICVITSIENSHLDGLGNLETIAEEKIKLWSESKDSCLAVFPEEILKFEAFTNALKAMKPHILVIKVDRKETQPINENQVTYHLSTETNERGYSQVISINRCGYPPLVTSIPHVSSGMVINMILSCVVAWKMGISDQEICERLPQYRPSGLRGSRLVGRGCSYVLDCYNANPSSMVDAVQYFYQKYQGDRKLLVLAGMNELGESSDYLHRETGSLINLADADRAILIGGYAEHMAKGMMDSGAKEEQISVLKEAEDARPIVEEFRGVVLLKGSRSFSLESLVPAWAVEETEAMSVAC